MSIKIYISRSNTVSNSLLQDFDKYLASLPESIDTIWHDIRYSYNSNLPKKAQVIVVLVSNFGNIGKGVYDEIKKGIEQGKLVTVAYRRISDNTFQFYDFYLKKKGNHSEHWKNYADLSCVTNASNKVLIHFNELSKNKSIKDKVIEIYNETGMIPVDSALLESSIIFNKFDTRLLLRRRRLR